MQNVKKNKEKEIFFFFLLSESTTSLLKLSIPHLENIDPENSMICVITPSQYDLLQKREHGDDKPSTSSSKDDHKPLEELYLKISSDIGLFNVNTTSSTSCMLENSDEDIAEIKQPNSDSDIFEVNRIRCMQLLSACSKAHNNRLDTRHNRDIIVSLQETESRSSADFICRICHGGESMEDLLATCRCRGTVALVHLKCLERWLRESNHSTCELCQHHYKIVREPRYSVIWSILMYLRNPEPNLKDILIDLITFALYTPSAIASTYMLMMICESLVKSNIIRGGTFSAHFVAFSAIFGTCQDEDGPYRGKFLGKLNSYHHQVSGDVYAVDDWTLLLQSFSYDGNGADTFFWAGAANRPGPQGFIVPDSNGRTNVLERYFNKDFTLVLPEKKKITDIKWFAIYDIWSQNTFGDIYIPEGFEPPTIQKISSLIGKLNGITTESVEILDAKRIRLNQFSYDGKAKRAFFWIGVGAQPVSKGFKVPDEYGYLDPLREYKNLTITLDLPGDLTIFDIDWFSIFDHETKTNLASIIIPEALNVPPSLVKIIPHKNDLPNCLQLHKDFQVSWEIFGPQITFQLAGQVGEDEYLSFGISGSDQKSQMIGADVAVAYIDGYRGFATDYNITALTPCVKVLGQYKGVCKDEVLGGQDSNQLNTAVRENGINIITYRRTLISPDPGDREIPAEGTLFVVWGVGKLDENKEPAFHDLYSKNDVKIELSPKEPQNNCFSFTRSIPKESEPWKKGQIFDKTIRVFKAYIGPSGAKKGYQAITKHSSTALAWYINGFLAPEIWLRRGLSYVFKVYGGNNPHSPEYYHPLIITDEPHGGFDKLSDEEQSKIRVLVGVEYSRRGRPRPTVAGPLCLSQHKEGKDRRLDDDFESFKKFNRSLGYQCEQGDPGLLEFTPNTSWPDTVYYNSFTQANMGWKIHIVDSFNQRQYSSAASITCAHFMFVLMPVLLFVKQFFEIVY